MDRPEDIPQWAWEKANAGLGASAVGVRLISPEGAAHIARALLKAREEAFEEVREVVEFYANAWADEFGFLASEPRGKEPNDALYDDEGQRARDLLAKIDAIRQHSQTGEKQ